MEVHNKTVPVNKDRDVIQKDALSIAVQHKRCGLGISMGVGKTRIAIEHLKRNYHPLIQVLVVVPKNTVKQSWIDELKKMKALHLRGHIIFSTYLSLNKQNPNEYDIVYLDECHSLLESHKSFLDAFNGKILGLTGTPPRVKTSEKGRMVAKYCPIKYTFSVDDATDSKILNDYQIIVHQLELSDLKTLKKKTKDGRQWYTSEKKDYAYVVQRVVAAQTQKQMQFASIMRMRALMDYSTKETYVKDLLRKVKTKCIVFANTMDQADRVCRHSYHSKNPNSEDNLQLFSDGRIDKLSCVLQLNEGVTIPGLKQGIIMHAYGNERKTAQRIGRLLRLNPSNTAVCHILCYKNTQDETWVAKALKDFDENKIKYYNPTI
jgi:superfamily II DNA or RNA helicase|tara:strand:- start:3632 stop:4759 length:1128 start_codon:yes stop_codon:yes gene_type:complete